MAQIATMQEFSEASNFQAKDIADPIPLARKILEEGARLYVWEIEGELQLQGGLAVSDKLWYETTFEQLPQKRNYKKNG